MNPAPASTLYLVDASIYVFRAWHSLPEAAFRDSDGEPANAVYGFARFMVELLENTRPRHLAVAFDASLESSFRNELYPEYKANRDPAPAPLKRQFAHCMELVRAMGLTTMIDARHEADDLIGTLAARRRAAGVRCVIVSPDKDLSQLLAEGDQQWDYARGVRWDRDGVLARFGVPAERLPDLLGLTGDAVDNIPGVPGIGPKSAAALLSHFGDLEALLARVEEVPFLRLRGARSHAQRLRTHAAQARLSRQLATIVCDVPLPEEVGDASVSEPDRAALQGLLDRLRIGPMTRRRLFEALG
ncbi:MAG TPA: 5'-3' exonuclease H3TH domain-containing protein [Xanthomonadaceae bacterium]|nr:5'-3' exonuclease H3TH domain-containing protein [Xanthomonadaceae bacterium]